MAGATRHPDAHGGHARPAAAPEAWEGRRLHRDRPRRRLSVPPPRGAPPQAFVKLATRVFVPTSLLAAAAVLGLTVASDRVLRRYFEDLIAGGLGREGLAVVRVSTTLAAVDAQVGAVQRAVALAGLGVLIATLLAAAALSWRVARDVTQPLAQLTTAARAIAEGQTPAFPAARVPEVAQHVAALRGMHRQLDQRFAEIVREREETATLIETMTEGVLAADARGAIVTLNGAARRLLGYGAGDRLPALAELFHEKAARDLVQTVLDGGEAEPRELERGPRALLVTGRALPHVGVLVVVRRVTELRRLEAVRRDFVANVSHELKTPLTSIIGYAETLTTEDAGKDAERFAHTILNNARRMQELVDDLLDRARIGSRRWQPPRARADVAGVVGKAWAEFLDRARARRIKITVAAAPAPPPPTPPPPPPPHPPHPVPHPPPPHPPP